MAGVSLDSSRGQGTLGESSRTRQQRSAAGRPCGKAVKKKEHVWKGTDLQELLACQTVVNTCKESVEKFFLKK